MYFNVDSDQGDRISGYLVPDSFSDLGRVRVLYCGRTLTIVQTTQTIPQLVVIGRHETGCCGFIVDETIVPGLQSMTDLELRDADSGILIYRRAPESMFVSEKLIRLETHMIGLRRIDHAIARHFSHTYLRAERAGLESMMQMFHLLQAKSLYLSGKFFYRSFEMLIERQFKVVCIVHDPYEELAERLFLFRHAARRGRLDMRDAVTFESAVEFAALMPLDDDRKLRSAFNRISANAALALQNPLVRQLTVTSPQEMPRSNSLAMSLTVLASCALVGLRCENESFTLALSGLIGSEQDTIPVVPRCTRAIELADRLRQISRVGDLLELDIELYQRLLEAYRKAAAGLTMPQALDGHL